MTPRFLIPAAPLRASRGTGRVPEARAFPTDHRRHRSEPSSRGGLYPASAGERREHFRLSATRAVVALVAFLAALAIFVLGVSI